MKLVWGTHYSYQRSRTHKALINLLPTLATLVFFTATLYLKQPCRRNMVLLVSLKLTPWDFRHRLVLRVTTTWGLRLLLLSPPSQAKTYPDPKGLGHLASSSSGAWGWDKLIHVTQDNWSHVCLCGRDPETWVMWDLDSERALAVKSDSVTAGCKVNGCYCRAVTTEYHGGLVSEV